MKKLKLICIILGTVIILMALSILFKDIYYTAEIKDTINLSSEEKDVINEKELVEDIKAYVYGRPLKHVKYPHYTSEDAERRTIPIYDGIVYGNGYRVNEFDGEFYISVDTGESNINNRHLYTAEKHSNSMIYLGIVLISIVEIIFIIIYVVQKRKTEATIK